MNIFQKLGESYDRPTPKKMRKLGDALLAVAACAMTYSITTKHEVIAVIVMMIGVAGKFLTDFYSETPKV